MLSFALMFETQDLVNGNSDFRSTLLPRSSYLLRKTADQGTLDIATGMGRASARTDSKAVGKLYQRVDRIIFTQVICWCSQI